MKSMRRCAPHSVECVSWITPVVPTRLLLVSPTLPTVFKPTGGLFGVVLRPEPVREGRPGAMLELVREGFKEAEEVRVVLSALATVPAL